MPAYLSSLSRRRFLRQACVFTAGVLFAPSLLAKSKSVEKNAWALLSDTHIPADPSKTARGINMTEHFRAVAADILGMPEIPAGAIVSGDLALNSGQVDDYKSLDRELKTLRTERIPIHLLFGNHDNRERFWEVFSKPSKLAVEDHSVSLVKTSRVNWLLLDSLEKTLYTPGSLGAQQLEWLARTLDANRRQPAIVVMHHHPAGKAAGGLADADALIEVVRPRRQVKAVIFGHTHLWNIGEDPSGSGLYFINLPPAAYTFAPGDPSGWVHAQLRKDGIDLELRCVNTNHKLHRQKTSLQWRKR